MKRVLFTAITIALMTSCGASNTMLAEYKELTKDVCHDNPHEVLLAQHLYNKMKGLK